MRSHIVIAAIASAVSAQSDVNSVPDALPTDFLKTLPDPVVNIVPGLLEQSVSSYNPSAAVATASAQVQATPLSVFPAATSVPINAAGEDGGAASRRRRTPGPSRIDAVPELVARDACSPEPTISNVYNIDVSSYDSFMSDPKIASVANAADTPQGYFQTFKNYNGANSASAYMGYMVIDDGSGYNVDLCAQQCSQKTGCLGFNIFFERDPVMTPGDGCSNPSAFANIKCSFWGVPLDTSTATNQGQWRDQFQVGVAGSNAYTSMLLGGPVDGYDNPPLNLNDASMQAPLRDCGGTWTYMGYKIYQDQPYDPRLCGAACDAQTAYNLAHPPSTGPASVCAAFGSYLVSKTTSSGTVITGQMCTMYTSGYPANLATNTGSTDQDGTKWTFSASFFYSRADRQPICTADIAYLEQNGQDFCSSYIGYSAPQTTVLTTVTPANQVVVTTTATTTVAGAAGANPATTVTGNVQWRRQDASGSASGSASAAGPTSASGSVPAADPEATSASVNPVAETLDADVQTVANLGPSTIAVLSQVTAEAAPTNGTSPDIARRAIATPTSIANWPASRISAACSSIATGTATVTSTAFAASQTTTTTALATTTLAACVVPSAIASYQSLTPIWGVWDAANSAPGPNPRGVYGQAAAVQLPFNYCAFGICTNVITVNTDGYFTFTNPGNQGQVITMNVYQGTGQYLYPGWGVGVYTRVTGPVGSRVFVLSWYSSTFQWGHAVMHVTATWYEATPNMVVYKYYDDIQVYTNNHGIGKNGAYTTVYNGFMKAGTQIKINTSANSNAATWAVTQRNRVDCCTNQGWHSCTEWQPQVL